VKEMPTLKGCLEELRALRGKNLTDDQWIDAAWEIYKRVPSRAEVICPQCGDYLPGHAAGGHDICTCWTKG